jgi:hypothetical protein
MRCDAYREEFLQALYAREPARGDVREHIATCSECAAWSARQGALDAMLSREAAIEPGLGFDTRFFARLSQERANAANTPKRWLSRSAQRRALLWFAPVALAGAAALAVFVRQPPAADPAPSEDIALMRDLELVEDLPVVQRLDEIEAFETLAQVDTADLDAVQREGKP